MREGLVGGGRQRLGHGWTRSTSRHLSDRGDDHRPGLRARRRRRTRRALRPHRRGGGAVSWNFYVPAEQIMKDRADYARKGIVRGRGLVAVAYDDGIAIVAENASATLRKVSEIYDRIAC